jgi:hypothetical protein
VATFDTPVRAFLPDQVPVELADQRAALQDAVTTLTALVAQAGRMRQFTRALTAMALRLSSR